MMKHSSSIHYRPQEPSSFQAAQFYAARIAIYMVAFLTGGIVMGFEMLGSRYLNPYFGSGIYTWASLISTVLAALCVGYFVGGWIADKFPSIVVLASSVIAGSVYLILLPTFGDRVLDLVLGSIEDVRIGSLVAAVLLMSWPVTCLGMYTPFAIRLLLRSTTSSGTTSGIVYGVSAAGSIAGTLGITFLLIPTIGSRAITILLGASGTLAGLILVVLPLVAARRAKARNAVQVTGILLICLACPQARAGELLNAVARADVLKVPDGLVSHLETEYNDIFITKQHNLLTMSFQRYRGQYTESISNLDDPADLPVTYTRVMTIGLAYPAKVKRMLTIGLGGGSTQTYLDYYINDLETDNVELDPGVIAAAKKYFGLEENERVHFIESDGRVFLNRTKQLYNLVMIDAFRGYVPFHLLTSEFYTLLKRHLGPDGVAVFNVHTGTKLYASTVKTLRAAFSWVDLYRTGEGNVIAVAGPDVRPDDRTLMGRATAAQSSYQFRYSLIPMLSELLPEPSISGASLLTDDFAPVNLYDAIQDHNKRQW
jgi:spermidine synthase